MEVYNTLENLKQPMKIIIALGNFDGVHLGHRELIRRTIYAASSLGGIPAVFTFDPHPMKVLQPDCYPPMLLSKEEKIRILSDLGIDILIILPFTEDISSLSPENFVRDILIGKLNVEGVVIGYNYNFGYRGTGDADLLKKLGEKYGFEALVVPPIRSGGSDVSSTLIRRILQEGNVKEAAKLLGYTPYIVSQVVGGDRRGREIGFPTANIDLPDGILVAAPGVYAVKIHVNGRICSGVANIGVKPTFNLCNFKNLEVHIFDFCEDIYGQEIKVEFIDRIRGERKFSSIPDLVDQIKSDTVEARRVLI